VLWDDTQVTTRLQHEAPEVVADPLRNPPPDVRARLRGFRLLDDGEEAELANAFSDAIGTAR
jgi:hypothetical protein